MTGAETEALERDIARVAEQERRLRFARFDAASAWDLGRRLRGLAEARGAAALLIDVEVAAIPVTFQGKPAAQVVTRVAAVSR